MNRDPWTSRQGDDQESSGPSSGTVFSLDVPTENVEGPGEHEAYRRRLDEILADEERSTSERLRAILQCGAEWLDVENGHLVRIDPAEGTHTITALSTSHPVLSREQQSRLSNTYCRVVLAEGDAYALTNAPEEGWARDPAYRAYGFATYVGAKVVVGGRLYGTVCFVDREPKGEPTTDLERAALSEIVRAIQQELARVPAEERIQWSRADLEALVAHFPDLIHIHDLDGTLILANRCLREKTARENEDLVGMNVWDLDASVDSEEARRRWTNTEPDDRWRREGAYVRADGSTFPVEVHVRRLELEGKTRFLTVARDMTERNAWAQKLRRSEERWRGLLEHLRSGVHVSADRTIRYVNPAGAEILGVDDPEEIVGHAPGDFIPKDVDFDLEPRREQLRRGEPTEPVEHEIVGLDGQRRFVQVYSVPIQIDGSRGYQTVFRDVTDKKRRVKELIAAKEEAEEASRLKTAMMANMTHEIRTPLTTIIGYADVLKDLVEGQAATFARRIRGGGERLMETLGSVLQFSKLEAGISELDREELRLGTIVRETVALFRPLAEKKSIALEVDLPATPINGVWNDGGVTRIVENLLENAIKFTPEHGQVTLRAWQEGGEALLEIEDTGIGIDDEALPDIFEAFKQESEGLDREYEGTGLGLSIVKRLTEAHGGRVEIDSEKGEGSRFTVRLPTRVDASANDGQ